MTNEPTADALPPAPEAEGAPVNRFRTLKMLAPDTREAMEQVAERLDYPAGATILRQDERTNDLYVLESGTVVGVRTGEGDDSDWPVLHPEPGDILGELSFLDGGPQHLTIRAETDATVSKIGPFDLLELEGGDHFYDNLRASVGITVVSRLRVGTDIHVAAVRHRLEAVRTQQQFGQFFLYALLMMAIGMIANNIIASKLVDINIYTQAFAWQYLVVLAVPSIVITMMMKVPVSQMGLSTRGLGRSLAEAGVLSLGMIAFTVLFVIVTRSMGYTPAHQEPFDPVGALGYLLHSFLQELLARGVLQTSFQRFFNDRRGLKSVLINAAAFGMFHIHFGLAAVLITMVTGVFFGLFYLRSRNLAGVTLLHFMVGACAFNSGML